MNSDLTSDNDKNSALILMDYTVHKVALTNKFLFNTLFFSLGFRKTFVNPAP